VARELANMQKKLHSEQGCELGVCAGPVDIDQFLRDFVRRNGAG